MATARGEHLAQKHCIGLLETDGMILNDAIRERKISLFNLIPIDDQIMPVPCSQITSWQGSGVMSISFDIDTVMNTQYFPFQKHLLAFSHFENLLNHGHLKN